MSGNIEAVLAETGALRTGHFLLASGRHSDQYFEKFELLSRPRATEAVCREVATYAANADIASVAGPSTGGMLLAFEVGRQLGLPAAYAERATSGSGRAFRRGHTPAPGERVLLVDDVLTTGGSVRETLVALDALGARVAGIAVLIDRSDNGIDFGVPLFSLLRAPIATFQPEHCPLCRQQILLVKPGTTPQPADAPAPRDR